MANESSTYIIIEDAYYTAVDIQETVKRLRPAYRLMGVVEEASTAVKMLLNGDIDLAIADVEVADGNSINVFSQAGISTPVIFYSSFVYHQETARRISSSAFILKPVTQEALDKALYKIDKISVTLKHMRL